MESTHYTVQDMNIYMNMNTNMIHQLQHWYSIILALLILLPFSLPLQLGERARPNDIHMCTSEYCTIECNALAVVTLHHAAIYCSIVQYSTIHRSLPFRVFLLCTSVLEEALHAYARICNDD